MIQMVTLQIDSNGKTSEKNILRKDIAQEFGMYIRDLRPVFSIKQLSTISPRGEGIILNFWDIKLVIGKKKVFLFYSDPDHIQKDFLPLLTERIQQKDPSTPFELTVFESTFLYAFQELNKEFLENESGVQKILKKLKKDISDEQFEILLNYKKHLNKLQIIIREIDEALEETMKEEEDMLELCLSKKKEEVEEVESILEHAWEQFEDLSHRLHELNENIDDTQEFITLKMANRRNAIIKFDLYATLVTALLSGLAVIVGAFGMNLTNHIEESDLAFLLITLGIAAFFFLGIFLSSWYMRKKKLW